MSVQNEHSCWSPVLEEIIDNAADLPLESQEWILRLAKGMEFTRKKLAQEQQRA